MIDENSAAADAELALLHEAFTIQIKPAAFFLGNNIVVHELPSSAGRTPAAAATPLWATARPCDVCGHRALNGAPLQFNCNVCGLNMCFPHTQVHACEAIVERGRPRAAKRRDKSREQGRSDIGT